MSEEPVEKVGANRARSAAFEIRTPNPEFRGERMGIQFEDGKGYTDDPIKAHATLELGYEHTDSKDGSVHGPDEEVKTDPTTDDGVKR